MGKTELTILEPDYYKDFHCVGGDCRSSCCEYPWAIFVNKAAYKKLRAQREPAWLVDNFNSFIKRNPVAKEDYDYAILLQDENYHCRMHTAEGLCRVHGEMGPEYLCDTCRTYPRDTTVIKDKRVVERSISVSCEETVRLLLEHPEPIQFESRTVLAPSEYTNSYYQDMTTRVGLDKRFPMREYYHLIRSVAIGILQERAYCFDKRMMLLTLFLLKMSELENAGRTAEAPAEVEKFVAGVEAKLYDALLEKEFSLDVAGVFANYSWMYAFQNYPKSWEYLIDACNRGIEAQSYAERKKGYDAFAAKREYFIENIMVSELYRKNIPFHSEYTILECTQYMVSVYSILRFMLGCYLADTPEPTDTQLIDFVAFLGKQMLHNKGTFTQNIELLQKNDMTTLPYLLAIIKG